MAEKPFISQGDEKRRLADHLFAALKKEYVVVGQGRVRAWHAWLVIGFAVGIAGGIIFVAVRSFDDQVFHTPKSKKISLFIK